MRIWPAGLLVTAVSGCVIEPVGPSGYGPFYPTAPSVGYVYDTRPTPYYSDAVFVPYAVRDREYDDDHGRRVRYANDSDRYRDHGAADDRWRPRDYGERGRGDHSDSDRHEVWRESGPGRTPGIRDDDHRHNSGDRHLSPPPGRVADNRPHDPGIDHDGHQRRKPDSKPLLGRLHDLATEARGSRSETP